MFVPNLPDTSLLIENRFLSNTTPYKYYVPYA